MAIVQSVPKKMDRFCDMLRPTTSFLRSAPPTPAFLIGWRIPRPRRRVHGGVLRHRRNPPRKVHHYWNFERPRPNTIQIADELSSGALLRCARLRLRRSFSSNSCIGRRSFAEVAKLNSSWRFLVRLAGGGRFQLGMATSQIAIKPVHLLTIS